MLRAYEGILNAAVRLHVVSPLLQSYSGRVNTVMEVQLWHYVQDSYAYRRSRKSNYNPKNFFRKRHSSNEVQNQ